MAISVTIGSAPGPHCCSADPEVAGAHAHAAVQQAAEGESHLAAEAAGLRQAVLHLQDPQAHPRDRTGTRRQFVGQLAGR